MEERRWAWAFLGFGLASWIQADSFFIEIPALYTRLPEGAALSTDLLLILNFANIIPVFWQTRYSPSSSKPFYALLGFGGCLSLALAYAWNWTVGTQHSLVFFLLVFCGGTVSAFCTVWFYGLVAVFPPQCTTALAVGEGCRTVCSGLLAGVAGLLQDTGNKIKLRFSISTYWALSLPVYLISAICCVYLAHQKPALQLWSRKQKNSRESETKQLLPIISRQEDDDDEYVVNRKKNDLFSWTPFGTQIILTAINYGVIPAVMPYFCDHYKNGAEWLKWSSVLSMASDPLSRLLTTWWKWTNLVSITLLVLLVMSLIIIQTFTTSWWTSSVYGGLWPVFLNVILSSLFAYGQTMVYLCLKINVASYPVQEAARLFEWAGICSQLGGLLGSIISWLVIPHRSV